MSANLPAIPVKGAQMLSSGVCVWHYRHDAKPDGITACRVAGRAYGAFTSEQQREYNAINNLSR